MIVDHPYFLNGLVIANQMKLCVSDKEGAPAFFHLSFGQCCRNKRVAGEGGPEGSLGVGSVVNGERAAIGGGPREVEIAAEWEMVRRRTAESLGIEEEVALEEREGCGWRREWIVQMLVVFFGDFEDRHFIIMFWRINEKTKIVLMQQ